MQIRRRLESGGIEFVVVLQPDGSFASLPAWMTEPAASRFEIGDEPHFPLHILRSMRAEVDALLEPESEVCTIDQGVTCVSRFSMTAIIASLAKPRALMASAS